ncbi:ATP synthase F1 [Apiospora saccharicola]
MPVDTGSMTAAVTESIGLVGLRNTATKNKLTDTIIPLWELQSTADTIPAAGSVKFVNPGAESVIGDDDRVKVSPQHFAPGGKYRLGRLVQVKCYIGYNGHESIHDARAHVQFRSGKRVATTLEWMTAKNNRNFDVSFIQVDRPFEGITPYQFADTPLSGTASIGVVGYPGDLRDERTKEVGAHMYEMFQSNTWNLAESQWRMMEYQIDTYGGNSGSPVLRESDNVSIGVHVYGGSPNSASVIGMYGNPFLDYVAAFDLHAHKVGLPGSTSTPGVQYITVPTSKTPDAVKGPVDLTKSSYGVFDPQQGFTREARSSTSPGPAPHHHHPSENGNFGFQPSQPSRDAHGQRTDHSCSHHHDHSPRHVRQDSSVAWQSRHGNGIAKVEKTRGGRGSLPPSAMDEEGFFDFLKQGIKVGGPILNNVLGTALPMALGPLGGPISSLASIAISAAGKLAESGGAESGGFLGPAPVPQGLAERAIMAEAAFQAMMKMDHQTLAEEGFFGDMWNVAKKMAPVVKQVAPKVLQVVSQPALQLALQSLGNVQKSGAEGLTFDAPPRGRQQLQTRRAPPTHHRNLASSGPEAFLTRFEAAASAGEEGLFDDIFRVAKKAVSVAGPVLSTVAKHGLPLLQGVLAEADFGDEPQQHNASSSAVANMEGLQERAILAEAALQAAMNAPQHVLEEEGFFSFMADAVHTIAPIVAKAAPVVIKAVGPVVNSLLSGPARAESGFVGEEGGSHHHHHQQHAVGGKGGLRPLVLHGNGHGNAHGGNGGRDAWKQLQDHHAAGRQGEEGFFDDLIGGGLDLLGNTLRNL